MIGRASQIDRHLLVLPWKQSARKTTLADYAEIGFARSYWAPFGLLLVLTAIVGGVGAWCVRTISNEVTALSAENLGDLYIQQRDRHVSTNQWSRQRNDDSDPRNRSENAQQATAVAQVNIAMTELARAAKDTERSSQNMTQTCAELRQIADRLSELTGAADNLRSRRIKGDNGLDRTSVDV